MVLSNTKDTEMKGGVFVYGNLSVLGSTLLTGTFETTATADVVLDLVSIKVLMYQIQTGYYLRTSLLIPINQNTDWK